MRKMLHDLGNKERMIALDALYTAASAIRGRDAMKEFFKVLLSESERVMLGRRILIARLLLEGETRQGIVARMGVGLDTVYRVQKWLDDQFPGYKEAISHIKKEGEKRERRYENNKRFAAMKRKYPLHFLLFPWPKGFKPK